jgi:hypothetical protein
MTFMLGQPWMHGKVKRAKRESLGVPLGLQPSSASFADVVKEGVQRLLVLNSDAETPVKLLDARLKIAAKLVHGRLEVRRNHLGHGLGLLHSLSYR